MDWVVTALGFLGSVVKMTAIYLFILMGPGLLLALLLHYVHKLVEVNAWTLFGRRAYLLFFGGLGTMLHELGHALMCPLFGHRIDKIELFNPDPQTGVLGYVSHSYNPNSLWASTGNFFIGIGPLLLGSLLVYAAAYWLFSETFFAPFQQLIISHESLSSWAAFVAFLSEVQLAFTQLFSDLFTREKLLSWQFWVFFYLLFTLGSSMSLSPADIQGALQGFVVIVMVFVLISVVTLISKGEVDTLWVTNLASSYSVIYSVLLLVIGLNVLLVLPLLVLRLFFRR
ncbi:M50 family metallopeptidase [Marinospirillum perlucidum]|uniref:M50 family metallopeptidase n=1 Tax=Marinospirillum perlucidum TaxID=1982602 RepID=UPI000DF2353F|nr:M50 family metallopeptidase [Marinospirillum perlucidum]